MKQLILRVCAWLVALLTAIVDRLDPPKPAEPVVESPLAARVRALVAEHAALEASGEYKRHQVYARLLKEFPNEQGRDLGLLIELAVQANARARGPA